MQTRAVIFDFDFTLGDSSAGIFECVRYACACCGYGEPAEEIMRPMIGLPLPLVNARLGGAGARENTEFFDAFQRRADAVMEPRTVMLPGAVATVAELRRRGIGTGIVSTKLRRRLEEILAAREIRGLFDVVLGLEDVAAPKPDPSGLLAAIDALRVGAGEALYVGDHEVDAQAAARAGVRFVGVLTGATTREQFEAMGSGCIDSLDDLGTVLAGVV
jgi:phosphoglycolate phosphatase